MAFAMFSGFGAPAQDLLDAPTQVNPGLARAGADQALYTFVRYGHAGVAHVQLVSIRDHQAGLLGRSLMAAAGQVHGRFVVDASGVAQFTVAWLNQLLNLQNHCGKLGGSLFTTGFRGEGLNLLSRTGLGPKLGLVRTQRAALEALGCPVSSSWRESLAKALGVNTAKPVEASEGVVVYAQDAHLGVIGSPPVARVQHTDAA